MQTRPILGTRGSPLALAQASAVAAALEAAHGWPTGHVEVRPVRTTGDVVTDRPLAEIGGKALWTKELDRALLAGETDFSVHSMKDVEAIRPDGIVIGAVLARGDAREVLIGAVSITALKAGAVVGTSSPRRGAQLKSLRPDLQIVPIRGNVDTRVAKVAAGEVDATLLAAAGLERLGRTGVGTLLPLDALIPAPTQAVIGVECRADDRAAADLLAAIDDPATRSTTEAERALVRALGGSCHSPVAALAVIEGDALRLRAELYSEDGRDRVAEEGRFEPGDRDGPAALARRLLDAAPPSIRHLFTAG